MSIPIFYSYSHKDERYKETLEIHLKILKKQGFIKDWNDRKIAPGENWEEEINLNLQNAKIVLLLVSSNFLASDYCYDTETIFALEQHKKKECVVIPIILKPCLWLKSHFKHLQALPKNGKPINTWKNKEQAWLDIAEGILKVIAIFESKNSMELSKTKPKINKKRKALNLPLIQLKHYLERGPLKHTFTPRISTIKSIERAANPALTYLILRFLIKFNDFYFSPLRIQKWGSKQDGFENLSNYSTNEIKTELESLSKSHKLKMTKSKKGNKIYKIAIPLFT